ncbi:GAF and ANTAR domain-containing protein [Arthrobacter sp. ISL-30]|uniref:GAF and ANTAR domain-containing protein n=1 Tax=Arthrobacter sp. ISL-30 TaxID=2819109 RepID=UPI001BE7B1D7|nr:GAF and ANTAR domain-containing protein [Arthrobacter sp. ISL-30]MBT2512304.1 GAF and ANTAR domain-containing protein [Arthrobacter sp. ISL-30]
MGEQQKTESSLVEEIQDLLLDTQDVENFLNELARFSAENLSSPRGEVYCGITLLRHHTAATVASSGERALVLDELQYKFNDGPCLRCCREGVQVHIPDLRRDNTFPDYTEVALRQGIGSILAVPFELSGYAARAGLNLYSDSPHAFDQDAVVRAEGFVRQASKGLQLAVLLGQHSQMAANLKSAMESRTIIDTAVGIIIAQNRCSQQEAVELIKAASSNRNVKLREVAAAIVESAGGGRVETHFT